MENKIYVKKLEKTGDKLKIILSIYDNDIPEISKKIVVVPATYDEENNLITEETTKEIDEKRPEYEKVIVVPFNYPIGHIEDLIKQEKESFTEKSNEIIEKENYFKNKIY